MIQRKTKQLLGAVLWSLCQTRTTFFLAVKFTFQLSIH